MLNLMKKAKTHPEAEIIIGLLLVLFRLILAATSLLRWTTVSDEFAKLPSLSAPKSQSSSTA